METNKIALLNNQEIVFTREELMAKPRIDENWQSFYAQKIIFKQKRYDEMNLLERESFRNLVKEHYYEWLKLNDEIIDANEGILNRISELMQGQESAIYVSELASKVAELYLQQGKDFSNPEAREIKQKNSTFLNEIDKCIEDRVLSIQCFADSGSSSQYKNADIEVSDQINFRFPEKTDIVCGETELYVPYKGTSKGFSESSDHSKFISNWALSKSGQFHAGMLTTEEMIRYFQEHLGYHIIGTKTGIYICEEANFGQAPSYRTRNVTFDDQVHFAQFSGIRAPYYNSVLVDDSSGLKLSTGCCQLFQELFKNILSHQEIIKLGLAYQQLKLETEKYKPEQFIDNPPLSRKLALASDLANVITDYIHQLLDDVTTKIKTYAKEFAFDPKRITREPSGPSTFCDLLLRIIKEEFKAPSSSIREFIDGHNNEIEQACRSI